MGGLIDRIKHVIYLVHHHTPGRWYPHQGTAWQAVPSLAGMQAMEHFLIEVLTHLCHRYTFHRLVPTLILLHRHIATWSDGQVMF